MLKESKTFFILLLNLYYKNLIITENKKGSLELMQYKSATQEKFNAYSTAGNKKS